MEPRIPTDITRPDRSRTSTHSRTRWNSVGRRKRVARLTWLATVVALLPGCDGLGYDREAMLGGMVDTVIVPGHQAFLTESEALREAVARFADAPEEVGLLELRRQWLTTQLAWKRLEPFEFAGLLLIHNAIEKRPPREEFIERTVAEIGAEVGEEADADLVEPLGSTTKGLAAIEYLIFPSEAHPESVPEAFGDPARRAFLRALAANLERKAGELLEFWTPTGENYGQDFRENDSEGADLQSSISMLANNLIELYETDMQIRLGVPMGRTSDGVPRPDQVEAPLSGTSLELLVASLESIRDTFDAGLDEYLDHLDPGMGEDRLSARIHDQFAVVLDALRRVDPPLRIAVVEDPDRIASAYEEMRTLLVLLKTDMAARLGITVTFGDADGD